MGKNIKKPWIELDKPIYGCGAGAPIAPLVFAARDVRSAP
jgi:hypothetical protein